jgi:hypothetical protein
MATQAELTGRVELAPPLDLSHHFSRITKKRLPSKIKDFYKYFSIPGIGNLAGGESVTAATNKGRLPLNDRPSTCGLLPLGHIRGFSCVAESLQSYSQ